MLCPASNCCPCWPLQTKNSEHTWGVSVQHFGSLERTGWNNSDFRARLAAPDKTYATLAGSWDDQMQWGVNYALQAMPAAHPLRRRLEEELAVLAQ
eukprot:SAG22_NODE_519_length_9510_cov_6.192222_7_plen_96_part_00